MSVAERLTTVHWDPLLTGIAPTLLEMIRFGKLLFAAGGATQEMEYHGLSRRIGKMGFYQICVSSLAEEL